MSEVTEAKHQTTHGNGVKYKSSGIHTVCAIYSGPYDGQQSKQRFSVLHLYCHLLQHFQGNTGAFWSKPRRFLSHVALSQGLIQALETLHLVERWIPHIISTSPRCKLYIFWLGTMASEKFVFLLLHTWLQTSLVNLTVHLRCIHSTSLVLFCHVAALLKKKKDRLNSFFPQNSTHNTQ